MYRRLAIVWLITQFMFVQPSYAGEQVTVYSLDDLYRPVVNLKQFEPMSESIKAILAMYALQVGGGCERGHKSGGLDCALTSSLGLGAQCSDQHLSLVRSWFKNSIPPMGLYPEQTIQRELQSGHLEGICYQAPTSAREQVIWVSIRVKIESDLVFVDAISNSCALCADGPIEQLRYSTVYRVNRDKVTVVTHKKLKKPKA